MPVWSMVVWAKVRTLVGRGFVGLTLVLTGTIVLFLHLFGVFLVFHLVFHLCFHLGSHFVFSFSFLPHSHWVQPTHVPPNRHVFAQNWAVHDGQETTADQPIDVGKEIGQRRGGDADGIAVAVVVCVDDSQIARTNVATSGN